jgi:hypothetical protein
MRRKALTFLAMGLAACGLTPATWAQVAPPPPQGVQVPAPPRGVQVAPAPAQGVQVAPAPAQGVQLAPAPGQGVQTDRDAGKRDTIRGVIAGVTVAGEMTFDPATNRAQAVEMSFLTIVGSPKNEQAIQDRRTDESGRSTGGDQGRGRHNVYALWVTPQTEIKDATSQQSSGAGEAQGARTTFDKLEIGDRVEVTYLRRENANTGGDPRNEMRTRRHGRFRTYYGDITSVAILPPMNQQGEAAASERSSGARPEGRDDDKDRVKNPDR